MSNEQKVAEDMVVSIAYTLTDDEGAVIDSSEGGDPLSYLHGHGQIIPGLEKALEGHAAGDTAEIHIPARDGYGEHDPQRIVKVSREMFGFDLSEGDYVQAEQQDGTKIPFQVVSLTETEVTLDGNHPLAGKNLSFSVTVVDVKPATEEELAH
ncbi:MAG: peptidylprolyl isomerase [Nitrospiraceae bacterium]|nr:peptidylprolyl isomerase [Nitrospiraceae bacterium]